MKTLTISLYQRQIPCLQQAVASGSYATNSEVMRDPMRL